jgi:hypothetical protein
LFNTCSSGADGGGCYFDTITGYVSSYFRDDHASGSGGGLAIVNSSSSVNISMSQFEKCSSEGVSPSLGGGAIYLFNSIPSALVEVSLFDNVAANLGNDIFDPDPHYGM